MDIVDYLKVFYTYRWMIISVCLMTSVFTSVMNVRTPLMYKSEATFFPLEFQEANRTKREPDGFQPVSSKHPSISNFIVAILRSRKMLDRIIEELSLGQTWQTTSMTALRQRLGGATSVSVEQNNIIKVSVILDSPALAMKIANAYIDNLEFFNQQLDIGPRKQIVQVIDRAVEAEFPEGRGTTRKVLFAAFAGLMISLAMALMINFFKTTRIWQRIKE